MKGKILAKKKGFLLKEIQKEFYKIFLFESSSGKAPNSKIFLFFKVPSEE